MIYMLKTDFRPGMQDFGRIVSSINKKLYCDVYIIWIINIIGNKVRKKVKFKIGI